MRWSVVAVLVGLVGAGCFAPGQTVERQAPESTGLAALNAMQDWVANATTPVPDAGARWVDGRLYGPNNTTVRPSQGPIYVASPPFVTHFDSIDGAADWAKVYAMLSTNDPLVHPDYTELSLHAIHGRAFPEHFDDGRVDGALRHWVSAWQVEWDEGQQDEWRVEWTAHGSGSGVSWGLLGVTTGPDAACSSDESIEPPPVDSRDAFSIASDQPAFAQVREDHPSGQLWLTLTIRESPGWERGPDGLVHVCPEPTQPVWRVRWLDLNATIAGGAPYVDVSVNAWDGNVTDVHRSFLRPPAQYVWTTMLEASDPMPGNPLTSSWSFDVPEDQVRLVVDVRPEEPVVPGVRVGDENDYRLVAPDGSSYQLWRHVWEWGADIVHPAAGSWTLERTPADGADSTNALRNISARVVG